MKILRYLSIICIIALLLTGCAGKNTKEDRKAQTSDAQLYEIGLDLISTMEQMIQSDAYASLVASDHLAEAAKKIDTKDYDSPIGVYCITLPDSEEMLALVAGYNADLQELWNGLSRDLKKQLENRMTFSMICSLINGQFGGNEQLALSALYTATVQNNALNIEETKTFLYIFEEGTPIAVTFNDSGSVHGQFLFADQINTLSAVKKFFTEFGCSVKSVNID